jgi:hypothetical protein
MGELSSHLIPYLESDLPTDLYSVSNSIAIVDESDHRISFNLLTESVISLSVMIGASSSPLGPYLERDLPIDLYSDSTPIVIKDESNRWIRFRRLQKIYNITTRSDKGIELSSINPYKIDLSADLYSASALAAHYNEIDSYDCTDHFRSLNI